MPIAAVHCIDSPSMAEQVVADIRKEITLGISLPGQVISLRDIADEHNVRVSTLRVLLERLENERLLIRRGDVCTVAPVDIEDVRAVSRLLNSVESSLIRRVCESRVLPDLDRLAARLSEAQRLPWPQRGDRIVVVLDELCRSVATSTERRIHTDLSRAAIRHVGLGLRVMRESYPAGPTIDQLYASQFARITRLLEHCRRSDAASAVAAARTFQAVALWISEFAAEAKALTPPHSWPA